MEKNGFGTGATAGKCFTSFWRRTCGRGSCGLLHVEENDWLSKKWSDLPQIECKKCCISEKAMVESIFKQTVILKNG
ncbi:hypothetical protein STM14_5247 [Salmonella enterica subsp. enterica serovar Typhimurium str. 14028S]|uniref:Uncharacterized protein n=1 Tax=Salmonella typhimurium (strain 14028s / SGSC 2262) TaxID=588858 RepID=A0A0F6BAN0_SALT1|nr:hypothetical protein STM14_5247 [Salmonella enterica subsp. enterica serovar Typhimurium str. 14028S]